MAGALTDSEVLSKDTTSQTTTTPPTSTTEDLSKLSTEDEAKTTTTAENPSALSKVDALGLDLGILSACDHIVATYSTFGMWAGRILYSCI